MEMTPVLGALALISEPSRFTIMHLLAGAGADGLPAGRIAERLGVRSANLTRHLNKLRQAGFIQLRRDGRLFIYSVQPGAIDRVIAAIGTVWTETKTVERARHGVDAPAENVRSA